MFSWIVQRDDFASMRGRDVPDQTHVNYEGPYGGDHSAASLELHRVTPLETVGGDTHANRDG